MNEKFEAKLEKIRTHLKNNKERYYIGITCFVAGGVAYAILRGPQVTNNYIAPTGEGVGNNFGDDLTVNIQHVSRFGNKLGAGGNKVIELDENFMPKRQPAFNTQHQLALELGVSDQTVRDCLNNGKPINGNPYMRLHEWITAMFGDENGNINEQAQEWLESRNLAA